MKIVIEIQMNFKFLFRAKSSKDKIGYKIRRFVCKEFSKNLYSIQKRFHFEEYIIREKTFELKFIGSDNKLLEITTEKSIDFCFIKLMSAGMALTTD